MLRNIVVLGAVVSSLLSASYAAVLGPGAKAPDLKVSEWVKGSPVKAFEPGKIYVVEFWATWCGPCRVSIPHLTEMAHKFKGKVTFTGVSVFEHGDDISGQVHKFVDSMGEKMDYNVAIDNADKFMANSWMNAAMQDGIPAAFIIKDKVIQWIGHPMEMEESLAKVVDGSFDLKASTEAFNKEVAVKEMAAKAAKMIADGSKSYQDGEREKGLAMIAEAGKMEGQERAACLATLKLLAGDQPDKAKAEIDKLMASGDAACLQNVAYFSLMDANANKDKTVIGVYGAEKVFAAAAANPIDLYYAGMAFKFAEKKDQAMKSFQLAIDRFDSLGWEKETQYSGLREALVNALNSVK